jgi:hypothetical protein
MHGLNPSRQQMTVLLTVHQRITTAKPHSTYIIGSYHRTTIQKKRPDYVGPFLFSTFQRQSCTETSPLFTQISWDDAELVGTLTTNAS